MKRRQPREGWKSKFLRILVSGSPNTGWKNKKSPVGRFSFSDPCVRENRGKREGNRGIQTATNRERQHWCVEVTLWDSEATTRQCGRHKERERERELLPSKPRSEYSKVSNLKRIKCRELSLSLSQGFLPQIQGRPSCREFMDTSVTHSKSPCPTLFTLSFSLYSSPSFSL